jgi:hypothetical protein
LPGGRWPLAKQGARFLRGGCLVEVGAALGSFIALRPQGKKTGKAVGANGVYLLWAWAIVSSARLA